MCKIVSKTISLDPEKDILHKSDILLDVIYSFPLTEVVLVIRIMITSLCTERMKPVLHYFL